MRSTRILGLALFAALAGVAACEAPTAPDPGGPNINAAPPPPPPDGPYFESPYLIVPESGYIESPLALGAEIDLTNATSDSGASVADLAAPEVAATRSTRPAFVTMHLTAPPNPYLTV